MMRVDEKLSAKFANMAFVCACFVVAQHMPFDMSAYGLAKWYREIFPYGVCRLAVPFFFLASGYFIAGHIGEHGYWRVELRKRIKTLLIPLVCWSVIVIAWNNLLTIGANAMAGRSLFVSLPFLSYNLATPAAYWFLRSLLLYVLFVRFFVFILNRTGLVFLFLLFGVYAITYLFVFPITGAGMPYWLIWVVSPEGLFYFSLGLFLRMRQVKLTFVTVFGGGGYLSLAFVLFGLQLYWD